MGSEHDEFGQLSERRRQTTQLVGRHVQLVQHLQLPQLTVPENKVTVRSRFRPWCARHNECYLVAFIVEQNLFCRRLGIYMMRHRAIK